MNCIIGLSIFLACIPIDAQAKTHSAAHSFPRLEKTKIANLGPGCRIRLKLPNLAELGAHYESKDYFGAGGVGINGLPNRADRWGLSLQCRKSNEDYVINGWSTNKLGEWELNNNATTAELLQLNALLFHNLTAKNSKGWAVTYDDTYGEDKFQQRTLAYCVVKKEKAVCGESKVGLLERIKRNRKFDLTPYVLDLLERIEFLEDVVPTGSDGLEEHHR